MADGPTEEELINTANHFLLSSPPGEFMEVVTGMFIKYDFCFCTFRLI